MRSLLVPLLSLIVVSCAAESDSSDSPAPAPSTSLDPATEMARVGRYPVTLADLKQAVATIFGKDAQVSSSRPEDLTSAVDALVAARLIAVEAERRGADKDQGIRFTLDSLEAALLRDALYEHEIYAQLPAPSPEDIERIYAEWGHGEQVLGVHILVRTRQQAQQVIARLDAGEVFSDLAREVSQHHASSRFGGGMGYLRRTQYPPAMADAIWDLAEGEYATEPVHSSMGWHVVGVQARRTQTLEEQRNGLVNEWERRQRRRADEAFHAWLKADYQVVYHPETTLAVASLSDTLSGHRRLFSWSDGELTLAGFLHDVQVPDPVSEDTARMRLLAEDLVLDKLAVREARRRGIGDRADIRKKLQDKKLGLFSQFVFKAESTPPPSREEAKAFYLQHLESFRAPASVTVREILVDDPALADSLHALVVSGQDLADLAREYTVRTDLALTGGLWPNVSPTDPRGARIYAAALQQGLGLHPPLKVNGGHSVFEVLDISPGSIRPFEEVEASARSSVISQRMEDLIQRLRETHADQVVIHAALLQKLTASAG